MSQRNSGKTDVIVGAVSTLIGCALLLPSYQQAERVFLLPGDISPFLVPKLFLFVWIGLSVLILLKGIKNRGRGDAAPASDRNWFAVFIAFMIVALSAFFLERLGYLLVTPIAVFAACWLFGYRGHVINLSVSIGSAVVLYFLLSEIANLALPQLPWVG